MKKFYLTLVFLFIAITGIPQLKKDDPLYIALAQAKTDTAKLNALIALSRQYYSAYPDSAIAYGQQAYKIALKHKWINGQARSLNCIANAYSTIGDYVNGMQYYLRSFKSYEEAKDNYGMAVENNNIGSTAIQKEDYVNALPYLYLAQQQLGIFKKVTAKDSANYKRLKDIIAINIGECCISTHKIDSAGYYFRNINKDVRKNNFIDLSNNVDRDLGEIALAKGDRAKAAGYFKSAIALSITLQDIKMLSISYLSNARLYHLEGKRDSAEYFAHQALKSAELGNYLQDELNASKVLYSYYDEDHNIPAAYKYYKMATIAKDSLYSQEKVRQLLTLDFNERQRKHHMVMDMMTHENNVRVGSLTSGLVVLLILVIIVLINGKERRKANTLLLKQKAEIEATLSQLQLTQNQLIQSEKMASLGELTAGIAHEIQNPLNFVNNFSEVSVELSVEMKEELVSGNIDDAILIADDIEQNLLKIITHGKRADSIVKGMLQHSRTSSNTKELTDLNALTDEYLRLAYHGLRARDKSFNAELITTYSSELPKANVLPQDIGRVLLNLFTNAFYAVHQKQQRATPGYKPAIEVSTSSKNGIITIVVKDNGTGMPENIKDKIMQPFFTTKPTGQGTGLGLSLSYDIIVKAHGGEIAVDTKENDYTVFTISIPV